jgi:HEAT repeat protein
VRWSRDLRAGDVARAIQDAQDDEATETLLRHLDESGRSEELLGQLARHKDPVVRSWVTWAGPRLHQRSASDLLLILARDEDEDVRAAAIDELGELDPRALEPIKEDLHRQLQSRSFFEPVTAMWALAALRDRTAIPTIRNEMGRWDNAMQLNTARVVLLILEGREDELVAEIRAHNHELMPWLCGGAATIASEECIRALEWCADAAPDEECRSDAARELRRWKDRRAF